ncbi:hypothetical protein U1701_04265 [Sphingomonas sp. PB2P19]|uniref:hypothetical protein n=1 Tax=Sphingomonas rhamnosi TaxID=3096156 RepID=UPI002FC5895F
MLVDKRQRYFRRYNVRWKGRESGSPALPLVTPTGPYSIVAALRRAIVLGKATASEGKDTIDLIKADHLEAKGVVVLLFHRTSPNAADPAYRRKIKNEVVLRQTAKQLDEDQVVSSHFVISTSPGDDGGYPAVLEEIPGLSATTVLGIVRRVLHDFKYPYTLKKKSLDTNTTFKAEGVKSENLDAALKNKSALRYLTLTRTAAVDVPDGAGIVEPKSERARYKVVGDPTSARWKAKFKDFVEGTKGSWDQVTVEVQLDDDRQRTVVIDRDNAAAEILFVRSELLTFKDDLPSCSTSVVTRIVNAAIKLMP